MLIIWLFLEIFFIFISSISSFSIWVLICIIIIALIFVNYYFLFIFYFFLVWFWKIYLLLYFLVPPLVGMFSHLVTPKLEHSYDRCTKEPPQPPRPERGMLVGRTQPPHPQPPGCCPAPLCTRKLLEGARAEVERDLLEIQLAL